jgi:hypothetical protein
MQDAPWYVIPADDKRNARLFVSDVILRALNDLDSEPPEPTEERKRELESFRAMLSNPES